MIEKTQSFFNIETDDISEIETKLDALEKEHPEVDYSRIRFKLELRKLFEQKEQPGKPLSLE